MKCPTNIDTRIFRSLRSTFFPFRHISTYYLTPLIQAQDPVQLELALYQYPDLDVTSAENVSRFQSCEEHASSTAGRFQRSVMSHDSVIDLTRCERRRSKALREINPDISLDRLFLWSVRRHLGSSKKQHVWGKPKTKINL